MPALLLIGLRVGHPVMRILQQGCEDHEALLVVGNPSTEATVWTPHVRRKSMRGHRQKNCSYVHFASMLAFGPPSVSRPNTAWYSTWCAGRMINHLAGVFIPPIGFVACLRGR